MTYQEAFDILEKDKKCLMATKAMCPPSCDECEMYVSIADVCNAKEVAYELLKAKVREELYSKEDKDERGNETVLRCSVIDY